MGRFALLIWVRAILFSVGAGSKSDPRRRTSQKGLRRRSAVPEGQAVEAPAAAPVKSPDSGIVTKGFSMLRLALRTLIILAFSAGLARADVAVLVHGYLGDAASWEVSGVGTALAANGWQRAGVVIPGLAGPLLPPPLANGPRKQYPLELPSTAPLAIQADVLMRALRALEARHPGEPFTLVGHSAGGVVARLALVRGGAGQVKRLITIAAPHLGTERALEAIDATHSGGPLKIIKDFFGGRTYHVVKNSWPVLLDLAPAVPGSTLFWLNAQAHPPIDYVSVIRGAPYGLGDEIVPGPSQDLNNVPVLRGKARSPVVAAEHGLSPLDGRVLADLMR
jgi:pimeloyl-ACP methyl ester carboxylesterase